MFGTILSALAGFGSGLASFINQDRTIRQNQSNYEDFKLYNSPANQMYRLTEAGLNPYMINGVSNTLSSPFNVQNNTGLSSALSQLSQGLAQTDRQGVSEGGLKVKRDQLKLNEIGTDIRKRMAESAIRKGDAQAALLWSQGSIAELNANFWRSVADAREQRYVAESLLAKSNADYAASINPLRLDFYEQYYPEYIANMQSRTALNKAQRSQLFWSRQWQREMFYKNIEQRILDRSLRDLISRRSNQLGWANLDFSNQLGLGRLNLQRDYYSLANAKWLTGLGMDLFKLPFSLKK